MQSTAVNLEFKLNVSLRLCRAIGPKGFLASSLATYDFSTLYTTLPHNLIKEKLTELIEQTFNREGSFNLGCNENCALFYFRTN